MTRKVELVPLFDHILQACEKWKPEEVIPKVLELGRKITKEIEEKYSEEKYRVDRNHVMAYFNSIKEFQSLNLPFSLEHFKQITMTTRRKISPYPLYSGIVVTLPE